MIFQSTNEIRRRKVADSATINGIDYLEVRDLDIVADAGIDDSLRQRILKVYFLSAPDVGLSLTTDNVRIEGGQRIRDIQVIGAQLLIENAGLPDELTYLEVQLDKAGDFSPYVLRLVQDRRSEVPPAGFDLLLSQVEFTFKVECPTDFDCLEEEEQLLETLSEPAIDYLAKDYRSFRRLMLDRMSNIIPDWQERRASDLGVAMVELLAYAADYQSYYQDAVATEAYLNTARRRISVRRHARLLDYNMHDGMNARVFVALCVQAAGAADDYQLLAGTQFLTKVPNEEVSITPEKLQSALNAGARVFEAMHDLTLRADRNTLEFYTWGEPSAVLEKGATRAFFKLSGSLNDLDLSAGDVLLLEELRSPVTGRDVDADTEKRHAVRLNAAPSVLRDELFNEDVIEVSWYDSDALPFDLTMGVVVDENENEFIISTAYGNVVLADHGQTFPNQDLNPPEAPQVGRYRPTLRGFNVTQRETYDDETARQTSALDALNQDIRRAEPAVTLLEDDEEWTAQSDLLNSDRFATNFVVEVENAGSARLGFGDNVLGKRPPGGARFAATYRLGNGRDGNVGAGSISHIVNDFGGGVSPIDMIRNPLPAQGGVQPETIQQVKLYAPRQFQSQERAVTEEDYVRIAERSPDVQKAQATLRWTGSWHTVFISIDREGGLPVDEDFKDQMTAFIDPFRLTGHDLEIEEPFFVGLDILLRVRVQEGYLQTSVKEALLDLFSNAEREDGTTGFFNPDNFTFGQPVYLSGIVAAAQNTVGVEWVDTVRFGRFGQESNDAIISGRITVERLEIVRLDNDPNAPENGKIDFIMEGGL